MNFRNVAGVLSLVCAVVACLLLPPALLALADRSSDGLALSLSCVAGALVSLSLKACYGKKPLRGLEMGIREGVGVTGFSWVLASMIGAMPLWLSGTCGYTDAFFETMSGFTTTGATILTDIEALPRGLLLWRSLER